MQVDRFRTVVGGAGSPGGSRRRSRWSRCWLLVAVAMLAALVGPPFASSAHAATALPKVQRAVATRAQRSGAAASRRAQQALVTPAAAGEYLPIQAVRVLDTRFGLGAPMAPVGAGGSVSVQVLGQGGVPAGGVLAVALNVSATNTSVNGSFLRVYAQGDAMPSTSALTTAAGASTNNMVIVPVGSTGGVTIWNDAGTTDLIADVEGYVSDSTVTSADATFVPQELSRVADTRTGLGGRNTPLVPAQTMNVTLGGVTGGVPASGVAAVAVNLSLVSPSATGAVTAWQTGQSAPQDSSISVSALVSVTKTVIIPASSASAASMSVTLSAGSSNVVADVEGYWLAPTAGSQGETFIPVTNRVLDTRVGIGAPTGQLTSGSTTTVTAVTGQASVPVGDVSAVMVNLQAPNTTVSGTAELYAAGTTRPTSGVDLQFSTTLTGANLATVPVSSAGKVSIYITGQTDLVADVVGYFLNTELTSPLDGARAATTLGLSAVASTAFPDVSYWWRPGTTGAFTVIPPADVENVGTGSPISSWPIAASGGVFPALSWQVTNTLGAATGSLQVEACVDAAAPADQSTCSAPSGVQVTPHAFDGSWATDTAGPGTVALTTGDYQVSGSDAQVSTYDGSLSVGRDFDSFADDHLSAGQKDLEFPTSTTNTFFPYQSTVAASSAQAYTGTQSLAVTPGTGGSSTNTFVNFGQDNAVELSEGMLPGHTYRLSSWEYVPAATGLPVGGTDNANAEQIMGLWHTSAGWGSTASAAPTTLATWTRLSVTFTVPMNADGALVRLYNGKAQGSGKVVYYDDSSLTDVGIFGPGWRSDLPGPDAGAADETLVDHSALGYVSLLDADGDQDTYVAASVGSSTFTGVGDADDGSVLTKVSSTSFTLKDADGTVTTWAINGTTWQVSSVQETGSAANNATHYTWVTEPGVQSGSTVPIVSQIIGPTPPGLTTSCASAPTQNGCRSLSLTYASSNTASGLGSAQWGNMTGQLQSVSYLAYDPVTATMLSTPVAAYAYDNTGMLRAVWDPRLTTPLKTTYSYDSAGRISTVTPPGLAAWTIGYDSAGRLSSVSRPDPSGPTATTTLAYGVPLSGSGLPDVTAATDASWGQTSDLPVTGTAIFNPDHVPAASPTSSDWPYATVHYLDVNGRETNTATYGAGAWQYGATSYDNDGNDIWSLTAGNRVQALVPVYGVTDPGVYGTSTSSDRAQLLATASTYSTDGVELLDTLGPTHPVTLPDGTVIDGRDHTHTVFSDQDGSEPLSTQTGYTGPYRLATTSTDGAFNIADGTDHDIRTTTNGYAPLDGSSTTGPTSGWTLHTPTTVTTVVPGGSSVVTGYVFDSSGRTLQKRMPSDTGGTGAGTTTTTYYTWGTTGTCVNETFAGLVCSVGPVAASTPTVPTTTSTYDYYGQPLTVTETSGSDTRTTTTAYDAAERPLTVTTTSTLGTALPAVTTAYDPATGLPTTTSTGSGGTAVTLSTGYDSLGQATSYTDADANTSTTSYDLDGRVTSAYDGKGTTATGYDGTDASGLVEHRGLVTSETDSAIGAFSVGYDPDGNVAVEDYPTGVSATWVYNNAGDPVSLTYAKGGTTIAAYTETYNAHGQVAQAGTPLNTQAYAYDGDGRLTQTQDTTSPAAGSGLTATCSTRDYTYDVDSNRLTQASHPASAGTTCSDSTTPTSSATHTYDAADRITDTGYTYDGLGRTLTVPAAGTTGTGTLTLAYFANDYVNTETQNGSTVSYTLDPQQERPRTQTTSATGITTTNHYAGSSDSPAWVSNSDGSWTRNVEGPDGSLAGTADSTGTLTLDLPDLHGDIGATIADTTAAPASSATLLAYTEFGSTDTQATPTTSTVGGASADYGYEGEHRRSAGDLSGLMLMGQRLYNPTTGRFLQTDPIPGGSANNYDYANQDPINNTDLNGQHWWHHHWKHWLRSARHWAYNNRSLIASIAADGICLSGIATIWCGVAEGAAWLVRSQQRGWSHYRSNSEDFAITGAFLGLGAAQERGYGEGENKIGRRYRVGFRAFSGCMASSAWFAKI